MLHFYDVPSKSFIVDCESYHTLFSYDYIGSIETENAYEPAAFIQIGDDDAEDESKKMIQFIVAIRQFAGCFYTKLKDYLFVEQADLQPKLETSPTVGISISGS
jgi:hypothetical protein